MNSQPTLPPTSPSTFPSSPPSRLALIGVILIGIATIAVVASTLSVMMSAYTNVPNRDQWHVLARAETILEHDGSIFDAIWQLHAGHRMAIPYVFHLSSIAWGGYQAYPFILLGLAIQVFISSLHIRLILTGVVGGAAQWAAALLVPALLFSMVGIENFIWPMQISCFFVHGFGIFGLYLIASAKQGRTLVYALVLGCLCSLSMMQGLAFWPTSLLVLFKLRYWRWAGAYGVTGIAMVWACTAGNPWVANVGTSESLVIREIGLRAIHFLTFLGAPASHVDSRLAMAAGLLLLVIALGAIGRLHRAPYDKAQAFFAASSVFSALALVAIYAGRFSSIELGWEYLISFRLTSRYSMTACYLWASVLCLCACGNRKSISVTTSPALMMATAILMMFGTFSTQLAHGRWWVTHFEAIDEAGRRLQLSEPTGDWMKVISRSSSEVVRLQPFMRSRSLAFYADRSKETDGTDPPIP